MSKIPATPKSVTELVFGIIPMEIKTPRNIPYFYGSRLVPETTESLKEMSAKEMWEFFEKEAEG